MEELPKDHHLSRERLVEFRDRLRAKRHGRTFEEVVKSAFDNAKPGQLIEVPIDSELWPTAGLSDTQVEMLSEMIDGRPTKR